VTYVIINLIFFFNLPFCCLHLPPIYSETWILCSLNLYFLWLYMPFYHFCQDFHENNVKLSYTYVTSAQFVNYTFKLRINWHAASVLSVLNWTLNKHIIFSYNFLRILSSNHTHYMYVWATNTIPFLQHSGQVWTSVSRSARLLRCTHYMTQNNVHYMHSINTRQLPSVVWRAWYFADACEIVLTQEFQNFYGCV